MPDVQFDHGLSQILHEPRPGAIQSTFSPDQNIVHSRPGMIVEEVVNGSF